RMLRKLQRKFPHLNKNVNVLLDSDSDQSDETLSKLKSEILSFFQTASVDELTLIAGCSLKKAQKITELRSFKTWKNLVRELRILEVVKGLMSKYLTSQISEKYLIGLNWLALLHRNKLSEILADEMDTFSSFRVWGRPFKSISFLAHLYQEENHGPHLITVPASTLEHELAALPTPHGHQRKLTMSCMYTVAVIYSNASVVIKNKCLELYYSHMVCLCKSMSVCCPDGVNHWGLTPFAPSDTQVSLPFVSPQAKYRLLLTGTPLQNNLLELMSLLNFIMHNMLSSSTSQISKMFSMKYSEEQSSFERDRITHGKLIMKPFILRLVKSEILHNQLSAKEEQVEFCAMSEKQQELYSALFHKLKRSSNGEKRELTNVMMQLRKLSNHSLLHRQYYITEKLKATSRLMLEEPRHLDADPALIKEDMEVLSDFELHRLCQQYSALQEYQLDTDILLDSGKLGLLAQLLNSLKEKVGENRFLQFKMMLDILEVFLRHHKHRYNRLDGSTPMSDRIELIDQFNTDQDIFVFLLSTRAGGLGINLTSANVVIIHDIDCDPYNDKQTEGRCHQVGQTRTVKVINSQGFSPDTSPDDMSSLLKAPLGL
uniref:SNF2 related chromatin remodeling ATPase with DExD box 1b n=1 Tax=Cyprinus carpio carpio TaxID=630221 RepID=A0A9J8D0N0_CYPCA